MTIFLLGLLLIFILGAGGGFFGYRVGWYTSREFGRILAGTVILILLLWILTDVYLVPVSQPMEQ